MGPRLNCFSPVDRSSKIAGARGELGPSQIKDRDHILLILEVKETFPTTCAQKGSSEVKREGASPHNK